MFYNRAEICLKVSDDDAEDVRERREREEAVSREKVLRKMTGQERKREREEENRLWCRMNNNIKKAQNTQKNPTF